MEKAERLEGPDGQLIGWYNPETRLWTKAGVKNTHLMRKFGDTPGWDAETFDRLGTELSGLWAFNKTTSWRVAQHIFAKHKVEGDYGHGRQYFLPREFWVVEEHAGSPRSSGRVRSRQRARRPAVSPGVGSLAQPDALGVTS
jgi:hypothetical protein